MKGRHGRWRAYAVGMLLSWSYLAGWDLAPRAQGRAFALHLVAVAAVIAVVLRNRPELRPGRIGTQADAPPPPQTNPVPVRY